MLGSPYFPIIKTIIDLPHFPRRTPFRRRENELRPARQKYGNNEVDRRRENQRGRIAEEIESGQLTAGEAARLESQESNINKELRAFRKANGGNLTNKEKAQINRQQNRESARIYEKKHNAPHRPR